MSAIDDARRARARASVTSLPNPFLIIPRDHSPQQVKNLIRKQQQLRSQEGSIEPATRPSPSSQADLFNFSTQYREMNREVPDVAYPTRPIAVTHNIYIKNLVTLEQVKLDFVPLKLEFNPTTSDVVIASIGRNNPFYHYTGAEDTLEFEIDWIANEESREDVLLRCKILESFSKADGYTNKKPEVKIIWGDKLFSDATWILCDAKYELSLFHWGKSGLPCQAIQNVVFKKIERVNSTHSRIKQLGS